MNNPEQTPAETTWPGVDTAYDFVIPSYQWILARFEAVSARIQSLQAFATTVTLGVPAVAISIRGDITFKSVWFISALLLFLAIVIIGLITRPWGSVILADPQKFYDKWLHFQEWEFKKNAIYWAGEHFAANVSLVNRKARMMTIMTILFLVEAGFLLVWIIRGT